MVARAARLIPTVGLLAALLTASAAAADGAKASAPPAAPYLPLAPGNRWTFLNGAAFADVGAQTIACSCPIAGRSVERIDAIGPSGIYLSSLYFGRGPWSPGGLQGRVMTYLVGSSADRGRTVVLTYQSTDGGVLGYPAIDDRPVAGETLTLLNHDGTTNEQTVVLSAGGRLATRNGDVQDVAAARLTARATSLVLAFARGVGFASMSYGGGNTALAAFAAATAPTSAPIAPGGEPARAVNGDGLTAAARVIDAVIRQ